VLAKEDAGSEASEWELRECRGLEGEREAVAVALGAAGGLGCRGGAAAVPAHALFHGIGRRGVGDGPRFLLLFLSLFPWCASILGAGLGGGQRGACNVPPPRGQRTGNLGKMYAAILERLNASMNKQKKNIVLSVLLSHAECTPIM